MCKKKPKHISFLLGAGFSVPAGYPTANILNSIIKANIYDYIRSFPKNGKNDILHSYILEKVLIDYDECDLDFNYESYYDFLEREKTQKLDKNRLLSFLERGMYGYLLKCSKCEDIEFEKICAQLQNILNGIVKECNHYSEYVKGVEDWYQNIIAHSVLGYSPNGKVGIFNPCYKGIMDILSFFINQCYIIDIFTLNHDLLLESLLSLTGLKDKVCCGFGENIERINKTRYKIFDIYNFNKPIRIYKLHGSIDIHELSFAEKQEKQYIQIVDGYSDKNAFLMNDKKFSSIYPLFLTGKTSKEIEYTKDPYKLLFNEFTNNIEKTEKLIIIGYSGNDEELNAMIDKKCNNNNIYVVSPKAKEHPFVIKKKAKAINKGIEFLSIDDIKNMNGDDIC